MVNSNNNNNSKNLEANGLVDNENKYTKFCNNNIYSALASEEETELAEVANSNSEIINSLKSVHFSRSLTATRSFKKYHPIRIPSVKQQQRKPTKSCLKKIVSDSSKNPVMTFKSLLPQSILKQHQHN